MSSRIALATVITCCVALVLPACSHEPDASISAPITAPEVFETTPYNGSECVDVAYESAYDLDLAPLADHIALEAIEGDTTRPQSKFGGQPNWVAEPQWPLSRSTGQQMEFIGQIELAPELFPESKSQMAYIFATENALAGGGLPTHDPSAGESAVILQPAGIPLVDVVNRSNGPSVVTYFWSEDVEEYREVTYLISTDRVSDPSFVPGEQKWQMPEAEWIEYNGRIEPDKIGGTPWFLQSDEFPVCGAASTLIVQFFAVPFVLNLADGGTASVFMNPAGTVGGYLFQSH